MCRCWSSSGSACAGGGSRSSTRCSQSRRSSCSAVNSDQAETQRDRDESLDAASLHRESYSACTQTAGYSVSSALTTDCTIGYKMMFAPDGRAFDWNGRLCRFTSRFSDTVYPSALTFAADQTRWAGSGTCPLAALPLRCLRLRCLLRIAVDLCGLEYDVVHNSALRLSI